MTSPALPIIDRPLDNTALALFQSCPRKYDFAMRQHRRRGGPPSPAIAYGAFWHKILELHYRYGDVLDENELFMAASKFWEEHGKVDDHRTLDRAWLEYQEYKKRWGARPSDEEAQTLGAGTPSPAIEISANVSWPGARHPYAGKIDRIIELNGQYFVEDHKTSSRKFDFRVFELSNQMMGYVWIARQLVPSAEILGVRINAHVVLKSKSTHERQLITFSKDRLEEWAENHNHWVVQIEQAVATNNFPGNYNACDTKYGMCVYSEVCAMPPRLRQRTLEFEYDYDPWDPTAQNHNELITEAASDAE